jgi:hypothetical protein
MGSTLFSALVALGVWYLKRKMESGNDTTPELKLLQSRLDEIKAAQTIRNSIRGDLAEHPDKLREPDQFKRD